MVKKKNINIIKEKFVKKLSKRFKIEYDKEKLLFDVNNLNFDYSDFKKKFGNELILISKDNLLAIKIKNSLGLFYIQDFLSNDFFDIGVYQNINLIKKMDYKIKNENMNKDFFSIDIIKYIIDLLNIINKWKNIEFTIKKGFPLIIDSELFTFWIANSVEDNF